MADMNTEKTREPYAFFRFGERIIVMCGYLFIVASVLSFTMMGFVKFRSAQNSVVAYSSWLDLVSREMPTITFLLIGIITVLLGQRLLTTAQMAYTRTYRKRIFR